MSRIMFDICWFAAPCSLTTKMLTESSPRGPRGPAFLLSSSTTRLESHGDKQGETWTTKKKVEVVTTKNIERTIQRQVVLEDGRVLDEEIPVVTLDTIENKEIFETDHDEEQDNNYNDRRRGGGGAGLADKVTTFKTTKDVTENVTKTEASHNIGQIAQRVSCLCFEIFSSLTLLLFAGYSHRYQRQEEPEEPDEAERGERRAGSVRPASPGAERQEAPDHHGHSEDPGEERQEGREGETGPGGSGDAGGVECSHQSNCVPDCLREN